MHALSPKTITELEQVVTAARETLREAGFNHALLAPDTPFGKVATPHGFDGKNVMPYVDLTNLKPQSTAADIEALCEKARDEGCATVCVNPVRVALAKKCLRGSGVKVICVVGFPLGASLPQAVAAETKYAVEAGAAEVDMVISTAHVIEGDYPHVIDQVAAVVKAADGVPVKAILETCKLTDEQVAIAALLAGIGGAHFVKTSTGFALDKLASEPHTGATPRRVAIMRLAVGDNLGVKASGGVKTLADAIAVLEAGANRIGASGLNTPQAY